MKVYDNYEISPCKRYEEPGLPGRSYFAVCEPGEADVWTLYGHIDGEGVEAIGNFRSRQAAAQTYSRITGQAFTGSYKADTHLRLMHSAPQLFAALKDLLGDLPSVQDGVCQRCGRIYDDEDDGIRNGDCPSDDCPSFKARAAITLATGEDRATQKAKLPPDPEGMNDSRAEWAGIAIAAFQLATGTDDDDALGDLIADLRHWADRNDYDFEAALFRAQGHYRAETGGEVV